MSRVVLRAFTVVVCGAVVVGLTATASLATTSPVAVTLTPAYGPVASALDIHADSGLTNVTEVTFAGSSAPVDRAQPATDTDVNVVVPDDATSGPLTLTYADASTAQTDRTFTVQLPTRATISGNPATVVFPRHATVSAVLTAGGMPVSGQPARLQRAAAGSNAWYNRSTVESTDSQGQVHWQVAPSRTWTYHVVFTSVPAYLGTTSPRTRIAVRPKVVFSAPGIAPILTATSLHGKVRPAPRRGQVMLDRRDNGAWHRVQTVATAHNGTFAFSVSLPSTGRYVYRVRRAHDATHWSGRSSSARVKAVSRSLHSGMSGSDVRTLQKRLAQLHYDVGSVTGSYGYDTQHAVVAFEKVQGISRDGVVGAAVWSRLNKPRVLHLRHPGDASAAGVEVDLTHQVVVYAVHGRINRILDASTGGGYYYTGSDGTQQQAITPTGHFAVVYKRDGWVTSKLGTLYRPAYFNNDGYAIHGEGAVPSYPASHGCVRITVPAMDRLNAKLYDGLSVWIYH